MLRPRGYNPDGNPGNGASAYRSNIEGATCYSLGIGDSLNTEPGNMVGPTIQGVTGNPGVCETLVGEDTSTPSSDPSFGDCSRRGWSEWCDDQGWFLSVPNWLQWSIYRRRRDARVFYAQEDLSCEEQEQRPRSFDKSEIVGVFNPITAIRARWSRPDDNSNTDSR